MRGSLTKNDMLVRLYELKNNLHNRNYPNWSKEKYDGANSILNDILDILNEYAR